MEVKSLYEQFGGAEGIDVAVKKFYERVLVDPDLEEFFVDTNKEQLANHQRNFLTMALGGPNKYSGRDMRSSHAHMKLEDKHFDRVVKHLADVLTELGANQNQLQQVVSIVEPLRPAILNK